MKQAISLILSCLFLVAISSNVEAVSKVIVEQYEYQDDHASITYPHFDGMEDKQVQDKMNSTMEQFVNDYLARAQEATNAVVSRGFSVDNYMAKMKYDIHYNNNNILSLSTYKYLYLGGAHGISYLNGFTFDLSTGNVLSFEDLFKWDYVSRNYVYNQLLDAVDKHAELSENKYPLSEMKERVNNGLVKLLSDNDYRPTYYLEENGRCVFVFQQYKIADGVHGIIRFEIAMPNNLRNEKAKKFF